jgi:monoamine oxidase
MDITNGAQEKKFEGGCQQISTRLAEKLGLGTVVRLNSPVSEIDQSEQGRVFVKCRDGTKYMTQRVIVALVPPLYKHISWKPELSADKLAVVNNLSMGHVIKTVVVYETAWWRDLGCSGQIWDRNGPVLYSMDDCKPSKERNGLPENPALIRFCVAGDAKFWTQKTREERKQAIVEQYAKLFNCSKALKKIGIRKSLVVAVTLPQQRSVRLWKPPLL